MPAPSASRDASGGTAPDVAASALESAFPSATGGCPGTPSTRPVVLATDAEYPDALSASYLDGYLGTGTLFTDPSSLSAAALGAIQEEGITRVVVVGGPLAISTVVLQELGGTEISTCGGGTAPTRRLLQVTRIFGADEIATSRAIATTPPPSYVGTFDLSGAYAATGPNATGGGGAFNGTVGTASASPSAEGSLRSALVANGVDDESAESAAVAADAGHLPLVLTTPTTLSPTAAAALETLQVAQVIVMGGQLAVSDSVVTALQSLGISVLRAAGQTASATSSELAMLELAPAPTCMGLGWAPSGSLYVTRADAWTEGIAGAVLAASVGSAGGPLVLTASQDDVGSALTAFLAEVGARGVDDDGRAVRSLDVLGGPTVVSDSVVASMEMALSG